MLQQKKEQKDAINQLNLTYSDFTTNAEQLHNTEMTLQCKITTLNAQLNDEETLLDNHSAVDMSYVRMCMHTAIAM